MPVIRISKETKTKIRKVAGLYQAETGEKLSEGKVVDFLFLTIKDDIKLVQDLQRAGKF